MYIIRKDIYTLPETKSSHMKFDGLVQMKFLVWILPMFGGKLAMSCMIYEFYNGQSTYPHVRYPHEK